MGGPNRRKSSEEDRLLLLGSEQKLTIKYGRNDSILRCILGKKMNVYWI